MSVEALESARVGLQADGFTVLRGAISEDALRAVESDVRALLVRAHELHRVRAPAHDAVPDLWLSLKRERPWLKSRCYDLLGQLGAVVSALGRSAVLTAAAELLDSPVVCDHVQLRMDDAANERALPLHQELAQMALTNLTAWAPLQRLDGERTGSLRVVPGSHREGLICHREFEAPFRCWGVEDQERFRARAVGLDLDRGDVLLFHPLLVHGSVPRASAGVRLTLVARLNSLRDLAYLADEGAARHHPADRRSPAYAPYRPVQ